MGGTAGVASVRGDWGCPILDTDSSSWPQQSHRLSPAPEMVAFS